MSSTYGNKWGTNKSNSFSGNKLTPNNKTNLIIAKKPIARYSSNIKTGNTKMNGGGKSSDIVIYTILLCVIFVLLVAMVYYILNPDEHDCIHRAAKYCHKKFGRKHRKQINECPLDLDDSDSSDDEREGFLRTKFAPAYAGTEGVFDYEPQLAAQNDINISNQISELTKTYYKDYSPCNIDIPDYTGTSCVNASRNITKSARPDNDFSNITNLQYNSLEADGNKEVAKRELMKSIVKKGPKAKIAVADPNIINKLDNTPYEVQPGAGVIANQRVNSLMMQPLNVREKKSIQGLKTMQNENFTINDKGYGNEEAFLPITETPALKTNSRVAGSSMSLNSLGGTFLKKYQATEDFFTNNNGEAPILNIMEGKPMEMSYTENETI